MNKRQYRRDYDAFYRPGITSDELIEAADFVSPRIPVYGTLFSSSVSLDELKEIAGTGRQQIRGFAFAGTSPVLAEVRPLATDELPHKGTAKSYFMDLGDGLMSIIGLGADFQSYWYEFRRYFGRYTNLTYLGTKDFRQALIGLADAKTFGAIRVKGFTTSVLCDNALRVKTRREWFTANKPVAEFFAELELERQWLRSIEIVLTAQHGTAHGRIRRDLSFSCQSHFGLFWRGVVRAIKAAVIAKRPLFEKRSIVDSPTKSPRPLQIAYDHGIFDDKRQNHRLIKVLSKMPDSGISVYHANPFLHATLIDYTDGSGYSIWITDSSAITIIAERKASGRSLSRLCNHINEHFGEGVVREVAG